MSPEREVKAREALASVELLDANGPDVRRPPKGSTGYVNGWAVSSEGRGGVFLAWSEARRSGSGERPSRMPAAPVGRDLYSTKLRALRALRAKKIRELASVLVDLDAQIAAAALEAL